MAYIGTIGAICLAVFLYLGITPMVNDETCASLATSTFGNLNRIAFQFLALCWVPWN
jgi:hypothetical protein